jgi:hypothetical protein
MTTEIFDLPEAGDVSQCAWCGKPLRPDSVSADFCSELHQGDWLRRSLQLEVPKWTI